MSTSEYHKRQDGSDGLRKQEAISSEMDKRGLRSWALTINASHVNQLYEFNPNDGVIINKLINTRAFILSAKVWADVEIELIKTFSNGAFAIIEKMGNAYGASLAKTIRSHSKSITFGELQNLASTAGWGKISIKCDAKDGTWIRIISNSCVFCQSAEESIHKTECTFLSGVIQGMAQEFYSKKYLVIRNRCYGLDDEHSCEIALQETFYDPILKRRKYKKANNPLGEEFP